MRQGEDDLVFTESENVKREIRARIDNDYSSRKLSNEIEKMPEKHIEQTINSGKVSVKITPDGRSKVMEFDTGEAETGGNDSHRYTPAAHSRNSPKPDTSPASPVRKVMSNRTD